MAIVAAFFGFAKAISDSGAEPASHIALTALASLAAGIALLIVPMLRWRQTVVCFDRGLVWRRLIGEKRIPSDAVTDVELIHHRGRHTNHFEVRLALGRRTISIVGIEHPEQLANTVRAWLRHHTEAPPLGANYGWTPPAS